MRKKKNTVARFQSEDQKALYTTKPKGFASDISPDQSITFSRASNIVASAYDSYVAQISQMKKEQDEYRKYWQGDYDAVGVQATQRSPGPHITDFIDPMLQTSTTDQMRNNSVASGLGRAVGGAIAGAKNNPGGYIGAIQDNVRSYLSRLSQAQAQDATGNLERLNQLENLYKYGLRYKQLEDEMDNLAYREEYLMQEVVSTPNSVNRQKLAQNLQNTRDQFDAAKKEHEQLRPYWNQLVKETKEDYTTAKIQDIMQKMGQEEYGQQSNGGWNSIEDNPIVNFITGRGVSTPTRNPLGDIKKYTWNLSNGSRGYQIGAIQKALNAIPNVKQNLEAIEQRGNKETQDYEKSISDYFKRQRDSAGMDFFDPKTYLYKLSGVMGSSAASWRSTASTMAIGIASQALAAPTGGLSLAAGGATVLALNVGSGYTENNAEVANAVREKFVNKLGGQNSPKYKQLLKEAKKNNPDSSWMSDDMLVDSYLKGDFETQDKSIQSAKIESTDNMSALLQHDMMATTGDAVLNTVLEVMPIGSFAKLNKLRPVRVFNAKFGRLYNKIKNKNGLTKFIAERAGQGAQFGGTLGVLGNAAGPVLGAAEGAVEYGVRQAGKTVTKLADDKLFGGFGQFAKAMSQEVDEADRLLGSIGSNALEEVARQGKKQTVKSFIKGLGGRVITSKVSEGIEEGKQHEYAERFKNNTLNMNPTFWSTLGEDLMQGFDMAYDIARIPADGLGFTTIKDQDRLAEIKGGMLAFNPVGTINVVSGTAPTVQQLNAQDVIINNMIADKTEALDMLRKNRTYVTKGIFEPGYKQFMDAFDTIRKINNQHYDATGEYGIDPDMLEEERNRARRVISLANDKQTQEEAKLQGIKPNRANPEYKDFVALKAFGIHQYNEALDDYNERLDQTRDNVENITNKYVSDVYRENAQPLVNDEDDVMPDQRDQNENEKQAKQIRQKVEYSKILARMQALLNVKKMINDAIRNAMADNDNKVISGLVKYNDMVNQQLAAIQQFATVYARQYNSIGVEGLTQAQQDLHAGHIVETEDDISRLIVDRTLHDQLTEQYYNLYNQQWNLINAKATLDSITGRQLTGKEMEAKKKHKSPYKGDKSSEENWIPGQAMSIIKRIDKTAKDDNTFYNNLRLHIADQEEQRKIQEAFIQDQNEPTNGWGPATINNYTTDYVKDENDNPIQVQTNDQGIPVNSEGNPMTMDEGMYIDDKGFLRKKNLVKSYKFDTRPTFGDWDINNESRGQTEEEFEGTLSGTHLKVTARPGTDKSLHTIIDEIIAQNKAEKERAEKEAAAKRQREIDEANKQTIDEMYNKGYMLAQKDKEAASHPTDLYYNDPELNDLEGFGITHRRVMQANTGKKRYYVLYYDKSDGKFHRKYNLDVDKLSRYPDPLDDFTFQTKTKNEEKEIPAWQKLLPAPIHDPQVDMLAQLKEKQQQDKTKVKKLKPGENAHDKYDTTSRSYFIVGNNGRIERYRRLHSVLDESWINPAIEKEVTKIREQLKTVADFFAITENQRLASQISASIDTVLDAHAGENVDENILDDEIWTYAAHKTGKSKEFVKDFWENKVPSEYKHNEVKPEDLYSWLQNIIKAKTFDKRSLTKDQIHDLEVYSTYIKDNRTFKQQTSDLFSEKTYSQELNSVLDDLANILAPSAFGEYATTVGNVIDNLVRYFFSNSIVYNHFKNDTQIAIEELLRMAPEFSPDRTYGSYFSEPALNTLVHQLLQIHKQFDDLGWRIVSDPFTWRAEFKGIGKVAGETDLIAVDKTGGIHIIDIKTSKYGFSQQKKYNGQITLIAQKQLDVQDVIYRSQKYKEFLASHPNIQLVVNTNNNGQYIIQAYKISDPFRQLEATKYGQVRTNEDFYTDQLNAYAAMELSELGGDVRSIEVMGFTVAYTKDLSGKVMQITKAQNYEDDQSPVRTMLVLNPGVRNTQSIADRNAIVDAEQQRAQRAVEGARDAIKTFQTAYDMLDNKSKGSQITKHRNALERLIYAYQSIIDSDENPYTNAVAFDYLQYIADQLEAELNSSAKVLDNAYDIISKQAHDYYAYGHSNITQQQEEEKRRIREEQQRIEEEEAFFDDIGKISKEEYDDMYAKFAQEEADRQSKRPTDKRGTKIGSSDESYFDSKTHGGESNYANLSTSAIDGWVSLRGLSEATNQPDFITNGEFEVKIGRKGNLYVDITYNGRHWSAPIDMFDHTTAKLGIQNKAALALLAKVRQLAETIQSGQKIVAKKTQNGITRTYGRGKKTKDARNITDTDLIGKSNDSLYEIEMSPAYNKCGYVNRDNQIVTWSNGSDDSNQHVIVDALRQQLKQFTPGDFVWIKWMQHNEDGVGVDSVQPIVISTRKKEFTQADIDFICDVIADPEKRNSHYIDNGIDTGVTYKQLLQLLFPLAFSDAEVSARGGDYMCIQFLGTNNSSDGANLSTQVTFRNKSMIRDRQLGVVYDLTSPNEKRAFIEHLKQFTIPEQHRVMSQRLGTTKDQIFPFAGIKQYLRQNGIDNLSIKSTNGADTSLQFDKDDFADVNIYHGLSGLGWYVKHGIFQTNYSGIGTALVGINDVEIVGQQPHTETQTSQQTVEIGDTIDQGDTPIEPIDYSDASNIDDDDIDWGYDDDGAHKIINKKDIRKKKLNAKRAIKRLHKILGDDVSINIVDDLLAVFIDRDAALVGNCKIDAIELSTLAPERTEFHEAFHRVLELLVPQKDRERVYSQIAKKYDIDTHAHTNESYRQIAEIAADGFADYAKGYVENPILKYLFGGIIYNKIRDWVLWWTHKGDRELYRMYAKAIRGKYKDYIPTTDGIRRFKTIFKDGAHMEIHGVQLSHVVNRQMYDKLKPTLMYTIFKGANVNWIGNGIEHIGDYITKDTLKKGADILYNGKNKIDIFGDHTENPTAGQLAMKEIYEKFDENDDALHKDIADMITDISTNYDVVYDKYNTESAGDSDVTGASIGEHTRASYEFSPLTRATQRVRFFFAQIPEAKFFGYQDKNGWHDDGVKITTNELGLPQFIPMAYVYNETLSLLHDCDSDEEMFDTLENASKTSPMFKQIYQRLKQMKDHMYYYDKGTKKLVPQQDIEGMYSQIRDSARQHKYRFELAMANKIEGASEDSDWGMFTIDMQTTDSAYNAQNISLQWSQMLANGGTPVIKISSTSKRVLNPDKPGIANTFLRVHNLLDNKEDAGTETINNRVVRKQIVGIRQWLDPSNHTARLKSVIRYRATQTDADGNKKAVWRELDNPESATQLDIAKNLMISALNYIGINFSEPELDFMLMHKYGGTSAKEMLKMFTTRDITDSPTSFLSFLTNIVDENGNLRISSDNKYKYGRDNVALDTIYSKFAFVKNLANWKYEYTHAHDQLTVLATNNNRYYLMSQNSYLTDMLRDLNKRGDEFKRLTSGLDPFTYGETDSPFGDYTGSFVLGKLKENDKTIDDAIAQNKKIDQDNTGQPVQHIEVPSRTPLQFIEIAGFKTDRQGDNGEDYFQMSKAEDIILKIALLQNGDIISPTRADKKSYSALRGVKLPGIDYTLSKDYDKHVIANPTASQLSEVPITFKDKHLPHDIVTIPNDVLDQFIRYAYAERASVLKARDEIQKIEQDESIDINDCVVNYYNKRQGARYSQLIGVYKPVWENGEIVDEKFVSFNNKNHTIDQDIKNAEDYFFAPKDENGDPYTGSDLIEYQRLMIARNLQEVLEKQIKALEDAKLIIKVGNDPINLYNYKNVGLDAAAIESIYKSIPVSPKKDANGNIMHDDHGNIIYADDGNRMARRKAMALILYISDISNKAIMSGIEWEKLFSGNPSFYKWKYDDDGNLIDRTVDELKRLGGQGSTGDNNYLELQCLPDKYIDKETGKFTGRYVCGEIQNQMIQSDQSEFLNRTMYLSHLRTTALHKYIDAQIDKYEAEQYQLPKTSKKKGAKLRDTDEQMYAHEQELRRDGTQYIDSLDEEKIKALLSKDELTVVEEQAQAAAESYQLDLKRKGVNGKKLEGIDVADGAAYITDEMCEVLLRMIGKYNKKIANAFKILRDESNNNVLQKASAYTDILTTVIGTQKYTAYGRRIDPATKLLTVYFNKYALFPIFKCIATGHLRNIYDAMKDQGVDMVMIQSAVKIGSQGAKDINWDKYSKKAGDGLPEFRSSFKFNKYEQEFRYLRKQLNTDPTEDWKMNFGTQMTKIAFSNMVEDRLYKLRDGGTATGSEILKTIMDSFNELSNIGRDSIDKKFGIRRGENGSIIIDGDPVKFVRQLKDLIKTDDPNRNLLDSLELKKVEDQWELSITPDAIQSSSWLESKLISRINDDVIDVDAPGSPFIQRSIWSMEGNSAYDSTLYDAKSGQILSDKDMPLTLNNGNKLQMVNEEGSMDCVLSIDFFRKILKDENGYSFDQYQKRDKKTGKLLWKRKLGKDGKPIPQREVVVDENGKPILDKNGRKTYRDKVDKDGHILYVMERDMAQMSFEDARNWLLNRGIIGAPRTDSKGRAIPGAKANIIAYRIPTQAQSSIHALRCVDVLPPAITDTVILPAEFTKITGSDFDIDKLFLSALNYDIKTEKGDDNNYHTTITSNVESKKGQLQNKIMTGYLAMLLDKDSETGQPRSMSILHRSIDNDTQLALGCKDYMQSGKKSKPEIPYGFYSLSKQTSAKDDYITGKLGIGPFALNNNNHVLTRLYHVKFNHNAHSIMGILGLEHLDRLISKDGTNIFSWLSAMINGHVDIAKDPWVSSLNVGPFTYNTINMLFRTGFGSDTLYYVNQPIIKMMAQAYNAAGSSYMQENGSKFYRQQKAVEDEVKKHIDGDFRLSSGYTFKEALKAIDDTDYYNKESNKVKDDVFEEFKRMLDPNDTEYGSVDNGVHISAIKKTSRTQQFNKNIQAHVYLAWRAFDKYAYALSTLVKYCKIDTKKQGKSIAEQYLYTLGYRDLFGYVDEDGNAQNPGDIGKLFEPEGLKHLKDDSYVGRKTENAVNETQQILKPYFISATTRFQNTLTDLLQNTGHFGTQTNPKTVSAMSNAIMSAIKSKYFVQTGNAIGKAEGNDNYLKDLVNASTEMHDYEVYYYQKNKFLKIDIPSKRLASYIGQTIRLYGDDGKRLQYDAVITETRGKYARISFVNDYGNEVKYEAPKVTKGSVILTNGANTMYDRLARLKAYIAATPGLKSLRQNALIGSNGMLIPGREFIYQPTNDNIEGEKPDTYYHAKFIKLQNFVEDGGNSVDYIIDAWEELLQYTNPDEKLQNLIRTFARDLVYYAFITSGDQGGFGKMFKYVPASWRQTAPIAGQESYSDFMKDKLTEYGNIEESTDRITDISLDDVILNNWFDYNFVPTYSWKAATGTSTVKTQQFIRSFNSKIGVPSLIGALREVDGKYEASIDPKRAPRFIKISRHRAAYGSQRKYTIYKIIGYGRTSNNDIYPIYGKVNPKGNKFSGGFLITEYGRNDNNPLYEENEYEITSEGEKKLKKLYELQDFVSALPTYEKKYTKEYVELLKALNRQYYAQGMKAEDRMVTDINEEGLTNGKLGTKKKSTYQNTYENIIQVYNGKWSRESVAQDQDSLYIFTDNTDRTSGGMATEKESWYTKKYGKSEYGSLHNPTTAVIRGLENAAPISTMKYFYRNHNGMDIDGARWNDSDFNEFKKVIDDEIEQIKKLWNTGKYSRIYIPSGDGFFNAEISKITEQRTPELYKYLKTKLSELRDLKQITDSSTKEEDVDTIQSDNTILSNDEILKLRPFTGNDKAPRIMVASELTDPAFFSKMICDFVNGKTTVTTRNGQPLTAKDIDALYIITKHDGIPMRNILALNVPKLIHFSITTLGATKWEQGVMKYTDMLDRIQDFIKQGLDPNSVTIRIDPIVPGVTKIKDVENVIKRATEMGIKNIRFSVMQFYRTTAKFMIDNGFDYTQYFDPIMATASQVVDENGNTVDASSITYQTRQAPNAPIIGKYVEGQLLEPVFRYQTPDRDNGNSNDIIWWQPAYKKYARKDVNISVGEKIKAIADKYGVTLSSCAMPSYLPAGIEHVGCLSADAINNMLGTHIPNDEDHQSKQRKLCSCYGGKSDILNYNKHCASSCLYCYAHHNSDKALNYYNPDGTLKQNNFTRTRTKEEMDELDDSMFDDDYMNFCKGINKY